MTITFFSGASSSELPAYIVGPVIDKASNVEIRFGAGEVLRVTTFGGPASLGRVRFYATQLPVTVSPPLPRLGPQEGRNFIDKLAGLDSDGTVVACLVPRTAVDGHSPLSDCR